MHKEAKDKHFLKRPFYEGGPTAMKQFIGQHLRYPKEALENKVEGTVAVKYTIDHQGEVIDAKVVSGIGYGCDEEAIRLTKLLKFTVTKNRGLRVLFHQNIKIHFRLSEAPKTQLEVQYNYVSSPKKATEKKQKATTDYTITFQNYG